MSQLSLELKELVIKAAGLEDMRPEEIVDDDPLFVEGLGLDSIDALEISVAIEARFGVNISDSETARSAFRSIATLTEFVSAHRTR